MEQDYQEKILRRLSGNERKIEELYKTYAEQDEEHKEFWLRIAKEEESHALSIENLMSGIEKGRVLFKSDRFKMEAIDTFSQHIESLIEQARFNKVDYINALSWAYDAEMSLLESKIFEVFKTDDLELAEVLNYLKESTRHHFEAIKKARVDAL